MLRIVITEAMYHDDIRQSLYEKIISPALEIFKQFNAEMVARGLVNRDVDPVVAARSISGNITAFFVYRKIFGPLIELPDFDSDLESVVDIILHGITAEQQ